MAEESKACAVCGTVTVHYDGACEQCLMRKQEPVIVLDKPKRVITAPTKGQRKPVGRKVAIACVAGVVMGLALTKCDNKPVATEEANRAEESPPNDEPSPAVIDRVKYAAAIRGLLHMADAEAQVEPGVGGDELVIYTKYQGCDRDALIAVRRMLAPLDDPRAHGFVRMRCKPDGATLELNRGLTQECLNDPLHCDR